MLIDYAPKLSDRDAAFKLEKSREKFQRARDSGSGLRYYSLKTHINCNYENVLESTLTFELNLTTRLTNLLELDKRFGN